MSTQRLEQLTQELATAQADELKAASDAALAQQRQRAARKQVSYLTKQLRAAEVEAVREAAFNNQPCHITKRFF